MIDVKLARSAGRAAVVGRLVTEDDLRASGVDRRVLKRLGFSGGVGETATVTGEDPAVTILVGVGPSGEVTASGVATGAATFARMCDQHRTVSLDVSTIDALDVADLIAASAEGLATGAYRFEAHKSADSDVELATATVIHPDGDKADLARGAAVARSVNFARDLVNEPGGVLTPTEFAARAESAAIAAGLEVMILDADGIAAESMGGVQAVNKGSDEPPRFVKLTYDPPGATRSIALVGKGITFDSGGLSIKPAEGMMTMKCDMGGAAAVIATMCALADLGVDAKVTSYTPMTDNMLGGGAQRPGDVFTARNGTTVEVLNTDAEGRLVLADALSMASDDEPDAIVDLATLTGACMVALGNEIAGVLGNDDDLIAALTEAGAASGDEVWHLPMPPSYARQLDSTVADVKNIGTRFGGTLTAALFLQRFVGEDIPWAHVDIAGPAFLDAATATQPAGASGFGVRLLLRWLTSSPATEEGDDDLLEMGEPRQIGGTAE